MTKEQFNLATALMFDAFAPYSADKKRSAYYQLFFKEAPGDLEKAALRATQTMDHFPSPSQLLTMLNIVKAMAPKRGVAVECSNCRGAGHLSALDGQGMGWAYRCHCSNGAKYAAFPIWNGKEGMRLVGESVHTAVEDDCPF